MPEGHEEQFVLDNGSSCSRAHFSLRAHCYPFPSQGRMYFSDLKGGGYKNDKYFSNIRPSFQGSNPRILRLGECGKNDPLTFQS